MFWSKFDEREDPLRNYTVLRYLQKHSLNHTRGILF